MTERTESLQRELAALRRRALEIEAELHKAGAIEPEAAVRMRDALRRISRPGLFRADEQGRCTFVDDRWCEITGLTREQALGFGYLRVLNPEDRRRGEEGWEGIRQSRVYRAEYAYRRPDGREAWLQSDSFAEIDAHGEPTGGVVTIMVDVSEERGAEKLRREAGTQIESEYREINALYTAVPVGVALIDREFRFLRVNAKLAEIHRRSPEDHIGRKVDEVVPELAPQVVPALRRVVATAEPALELQVTASLRSSPHVEHTWLWNLAPLADGDGDVSNILVAVQDITNLKRVERDLLSLTRHLDEAQELAQIGSFAWDLLNDEIVWTDELYRIFGYEPRRVGPTFEIFLEHVVSDDRPLVRRLLDDAFAQGETEGEYRVMLEDGTVRRVRGVARVERNEGGAAVRLVGTIRLLKELSQ